MALKRELYVTAAVHAAASPKGAAEAVGGVIDTIITDAVGSCHVSGMTPVDGNTCGCVPCRAWRTEAAEAAVVSLLSKVTAAEAAVTAAETATARLTAERDQVTAALAAESANRMTATRVAEQASDAAITVQRRLDATNKKLEVARDEAATAVAKLNATNDELTRLRELKTTVRTFVRDVENR